MDNQVSYSDIIIQTELTDEQRAAMEQLAKQALEQAKVAERRQEAVAYLKQRAEYNPDIEAILVVLGLK